MRKQIITYALIILCIINIIIRLLPVNKFFNILILIISTLLTILSLYIPNSFEFYFSEDDWEDNGDCMKIRIPLSTHKLGKKVTCQLFEFNENSGYEMILVNICVDNGDVVLIAGKGARFKGKAVIQA